MNNIQKLIDAIALDDKEKMGNAFASIMQDKVRTAIDVKNIEVAEKIYNAGETLSEDSIQEAKSMDFNRTSRFIAELSASLKRGSKLNKEVNKILGGNYDRDFKEMQDSMDDIYDAWQDIEAEIEMNEEVTINEAKSMDFTRTSRFIAELGALLKRGSKLNREINKTLGGNYDRDFKEMQDSMDDIHDAWQNIEAEIEMNESTEISEGIDFSKVPDKNLISWVTKFRTVKGNPWSDFKQDMAAAEREVKLRKLKVEEVKESAEVTISVDFASLLTEKLRAGKGKTTIDADYIGDRYFTNVSQRQFKIKIKPTGSSTADITGEKKDIIAFLQSDDYGMDDRDIKDLFPELLEDKS